ncbi:MAG: DNA-directed RNA polymerase subunit beta, partial [Geminicoccales bacterium]
MTDSFTGRKRIRKSFGRIPEVTVMPNLIEVQRTSYENFLQMMVRPEQRQHMGLQEVFKSVFPIKDFAERAALDFVRYELEDPKYDVEECHQRGMTYAAPLRVTLRLIVWDVDDDTGAKSVRDIKEQDVYMGDLPLMTDNGTFVVNGTERVIVSQMHRSPGVFYDHDKGKTHSSGKYLFTARIIPYRGSWLDFEFDAKDLIHVRIDRRRKLLVTTLLYALTLEQHYSAKDKPNGMRQIARDDLEPLGLEQADVRLLRCVDASGREYHSPEEIPDDQSYRAIYCLTAESILKLFYDRVTFARTGQGWRTAFRPDRLRGVKLTSDLIDAKTGDVLAEAGTKMTPRLVRKLADQGLEELYVSSEELVGRYVAVDLIDEKTGLV